MVNLMLSFTILMNEVLDLLSSVEHAGQVDHPHFTTFHHISHHFTTIKHSLPHFTTLPKYTTVNHNKLQLGTILPQPKGTVVGTEYL